jgi:hypothetical protein
MTPDIEKLITWHQSMYERFARLRKAGTARPSALAQFEQKARAHEQTVLLLRELQNRRAVKTAADVLHEGDERGLPTPTQYPSMPPVEPPRDDLVTALRVSENNHGS